MVDFVEIVLVRRTAVRLTYARTVDVWRRPPKLNRAFLADPNYCIVYSHQSSFYEYNNLHGIIVKSPIPVRIAIESVNKFTILTTEAKVTGSKADKNLPTGFMEDKCLVTD